MYGISSNGRTDGRDVRAELSCADDNQGFGRSCSSKRVRTLYSNRTYTVAPMTARTNHPTSHERAALGVRVSLTSFPAVWS